MAEENKNQEIQKEKNKKKTWYIWVLGALGVVLLVLAGIYFAGVYQLQGKFLPGTMIQGYAVEGQTAEEVARYLNQQEADSYTLTVLGKENQPLVTLTAQQVSLAYSCDQDVQAIFDEQNVYRWPFHVLGNAQQDYTVPFVMEYEEGNLETALEAAGIFDAENVQAPEDAYIGEYIASLGKYELVQEKDGNQLNREKVIQTVNQAILHLEGEVHLEQADCYDKAQVTTENKKLQKQYEQLNQMVGTKITYDWNGREEVLDGSILHQWIVLEDGKIVLDEEQVAAYVAEKAKAYDTYGRDRKFVTVQGIELTLPSGGYGWKTDREKETEELTQLIWDGTVAEREPVYMYTGYVKGANDIGSSYVEIDLTNQHLYMIIQGQIVLETDFVSGCVAEGNTTPPGVFGLTYKTTNAVLRGRTWETPVSYWMPFNRNIGMHDATWRSQFGGDIYLTDGSHGCINLPLDMAAAIFSMVKTKFPVVCYYY